MVETSENEKLIDLLYSNYPNIHAYQFIGQLKNLPETRDDFWAECHHD